MTTPSDPKTWKRGDACGSVVVDVAPSDRAELFYGGALIFESASESTIEQVLLWAATHADLVAACKLALHAFTEGTAFDDPDRAKMLDVLRDVVERATGETIEREEVCPL